MHQGFAADLMGLIAQRNAEQFREQARQDALAQHYNDMQLKVRELNQNDQYRQDVLAENKRLHDSENAKRTFDENIALSEQMPAGEYTPSDVTKRVGSVGGGYIRAGQPAMGPDFQGPSPNATVSEMQQGLPERFIKTETENQRKTRLAENKPVSVAEGGTLVNPQTGQPVYTAERPDVPVMRVGRNGSMQQIGTAPAKSHFVNEPAPTSASIQIIQTPNGYARVDKTTGTVTPVTGADGAQTPLAPTSATRTMSEGAKMLIPHIQQTAADAQTLDQAGLFGPFMSRVRDTAAKLGTLNGLGSDNPDVQQAAMSQLGQALASDPALASDRLAGKFATELGLLMTGAARVHGGARGGGSPQMLEHFKNLLGSSSSLPMFLGRMDALGGYMSGYAGGSGGAAAPAAPAAPAKSRYTIVEEK